MKTTGIIRCIDQLGRIVVPKEMCRTLRISTGDALEISLESNRIVLTKHEVGCVFCNSHESLTEYDGKLVCSHCLVALRAL